MSKLVKNDRVVEMVEKVVQEQGFTLSLSSEEAAMLRAIIGRIRGSGVLREFADEIFYSLHDAEVERKFHQLVTVDMQVVGQNKIKGDF